MTPIEKAEAALNNRIERIQTNLAAAQSETARQLLFQSLLVCIGIGEAITDCVKMIGEYARSRHAELKQAHAALSAEHDRLLQGGHALLEQLKANPRDPAIRQEIERAQQQMAAIQKTLRRGANSLQRAVAPSMALVDQFSPNIKQFSEAGQVDGLKRAIKALLGQVGALYRSQPTLPSKNLVDAAAWERSALPEIDQAADFQDAFARAGFQAILALEAMTMAVSPSPPQTADAATARAQRSAAARLQQIAARFTTAQRRAGRGGQPSP